MRVLLRLSLLIAVAFLFVSTTTTRNAASESESGVRLDPVPIITTYPGSPCTPTLLWQANGLAAGDYFGFSIAAPFNWDGDRGSADIVVGALHADEGSGPNGSCNVFYDTLAQVWRKYGDPNDDMGRAVGFTSWSIGDDYYKVVIGAPGHSLGDLDSNGAVFVFNATNDLLFEWYGTGTGDKLGYSLEFCGDITFDLLDDIIVGAPEADGPLGPRTGYALLLAPQDGLNWRVNGNEAGALFGYDVAYVGAVFEENCAGVMIGAPNASWLGQEFVSSGSAFVYDCDGMFRWRYNGEKTGDFFGGSVSGAADIDGDNMGEVIIGAPGADPGGVINAGSVYVYSSATHTLLYRLDGDAPVQNFGYSVNGVLDLDGDGIDDIAVGAHHADPGGRTDAGAVYVYSALTGTLLWKIEGASPGDLFGASVAGTADDSLYNVSELLVGAFKADPDGRVDAGSVYLFGCACQCTCNGDPVCEGVTDILDVVSTVGVAFRNVPAVTTGNCHFEDTDVDCSGATDIIDVTRMVNVAFRNADKATEFCSPCP